MTHAENRENVKQAVQTILNSLNGGNREELAQAIYETVSKDHRTLQQLFWSTMLQVQIQYADNRSDARNEQSVELAKLVKQLAYDNNMDMGLRYI